MSKSTVRAEMIKRRAALPEDASRQLSAQSQARLIALPEFDEASVIALYCPTRAEVLTEELFVTARQSGKTVVFPRISGPVMEFVAVDDLDTLSPCCYGICEPVSGHVVALAEIDLIVLPGVAFDRCGVRLGYGKGYYDRILAEREERTTLVGLAYDFQIVNELPAEPHDVLLDVVVTENHLLRFTRAASLDAAITAC